MTKKVKVLIFVLTLLGVIPYIIIQQKLAPIFEEEWLTLFDRKKFVAGLSEDGEFIKTKSCDETSSIFLVRKLPPKFVLCLFGEGIPLVGWGHYGPTLLIPFYLYVRVIDIFLPKDSLLPIKYRFINVVLIIILYIYLTRALVKKAYEERSLLPYFFPVFAIFFPLNIFFLTSGTLCYILLAFFTSLLFFALERKKFVHFSILSFLLISTHMRGVQIFTSLFIFFVLKEYIEKKKIPHLSLFVSVPISLFALSLYFIPDLFPREAYYITAESIGAVNIFREFLSEILKKIPIFFQFVVMRLGDFFISFNIVALMRELGMIANLPSLLLIMSIISSVLYLLPLLNLKNREIPILLSIYFAVSVISVPFFVGMPWQFIPIHPLILFFAFYELLSLKPNLKIPIADKSKIIYLVLAILSSGAMNLISSIYLERFISDFSVWKKHVEVADFMKILRKEWKKEGEGKIFCITKTSFFPLLSLECDEAKFLFMYERDKVMRNYGLLYKALDKYDTVILSYHFSDLKGILIGAGFHEVFDNKAFSVMVRKQ